MKLFLNSATTRWKNAATVTRPRPQQCAKQSVEGEKKVFNIEGKKIKNKKKATEPTSIANAWEALCGPGPAAADDGLLVHKSDSKYEKRGRHFADRCSAVLWHQALGDLLSCV